MIHITGRVILPLMREITWKPVQVGTGPFEEEGWMVLVNGRLVAILVHLSEQYEDPELRGRWFVEAGFGPLFGKHEIFSTPEEAEAWIRQHFGTLKDHGAKNGDGAG